VTQKASDGIAGRGAQAESARQARRRLSAAPDSRHRRQTVSEANNAGFNLYRSASPAAPGEMLAFVPSQAPGSIVGASYGFADGQVAAGETVYCWLEDVDLSDATALHDPVSATLQAPTAVTLAAMEAQAASPGGNVSAWGALLAGLAGEMWRGDGIRLAGGFQLARG
jgi:hypothetical protein